MSIRFFLPLLAGLWALAGNAQPGTSSPALSTLPTDSAGVYRSLESALRTPDQVRVLVLTGLDSLPPAVGALKHLQVLRLENGNLRQLPGSLGELRNLRELHLPGNQLAQLPAALGKLKGLQVLNLEGNRLTQFPPSVLSLPRLEKINLAGNGLESLPPQIGKLSALRELHLGRNPLQALPAELGNLRQLKSLDLGENHLTRLPASIGRLTALRQLSLAGNRLTELPRELGSLAQLEELNVDGNQLAHLPDELQHLTRLKNLRLAENPLRDVPAGLTRYLRQPDAPLGTDRLEQLGNLGAGPRGLQVPDVQPSALAKKLLAGNAAPPVHNIELPGAARAGQLPASAGTLPGVPGGNGEQMAGAPQLPGGLNGPSLPPLPSLPVTAIAAGNLLNLDSIRNAWLSVEHKRLREKQVSELRKDVLLKEKESLPARTFFEGVAGINNRAELVTFSPALGVGIIRKVSAGLGPVLGLNSKNLRNDIGLGLRSFARYELVPRKFNLQLENIGDISRLPTARLREAGGRRITHTFYAGAGYLIKYSENKSLNLSTLYQLNRDRQSLSPHSPFVFRVGFSAFNHKQK